MKCKNSKLAMTTSSTSGADLIAFPEASPRHRQVATKAAAKNKTATPSAWDDDESASLLVANPVSDVGQFNQTLLGYSS
jgi:hypothetical protein